MADAKRAEIGDVSLRLLLALQSAKLAVMSPTQILTHCVKDWKCKINLLIWLLNPPSTIDLTQDYSII